MAVFRIEKTRDYTVMSNYHLRDMSLSLKAKGLLSLMLSLPENWDYTMKGLARICKDGIDSISGGIRELEAHGYLIRSRVRSANGQLGSIEYTILEQPKAPSPTQEKPIRENPVQANPMLDAPIQENPAQLNKEESSNYPSKTDLSITQESSPKLCQAVRLAPGLDVSEKLLHIGQGFQTAFASSAPSFHALDTAVNDRPSSRLQFSDEERAAPELQKAIRKSDKAADKLDAARAAVPEKQPSFHQPVNPLARPLQEIGHAAHAKVHEVEQENVGVEAGHLTERGMEKAVRYGNRKLQNWQADRKLKPWREVSRAEQAAVQANAEALYQKALRENPQLAASNPISRMWQKKKLQKQYAAAYRAAHSAGDAAAAAQTAAKDAKKSADAAKKAGKFVSKHKKTFLIVGGIGLLLVMLLGLLQSCSSIFGGGVSNIVASSYLSEDSDLLAAEAAYCAMEDKLREYLDTYEQTHDYGKLCEQYEQS